MGYLPSPNRRADHLVMVVSQPLDTLDHARTINAQVPEDFSSFCHPSQRYNRRRCKEWVNIIGCASDSQDVVNFAGLFESLTLGNNLIPGGGWSCNQILL